MKNCPFCKAQLEDEARFCLYCMRPLIEKKVVPPQLRRPLRWLMVIAVMVLLLAIATLLWAILRSAPADIPSGETTQAASETQNSDPSEAHAHVYSQTSTDAAFLHTDATCTSPALYYYSCQCGEKGSTTFLSGETAPHTPVEDTAIPASCATSGLTEGSHCGVCNAILVVQSTIPPEGHDYSAATYSAPATCSKCGETTGTALPQQPINITGPTLPIVQYRRFRITDCAYTATWNGDGTYYVTLYFTFTNVTTTTTTGGIWATLSGITSSHGSAATLEPGESGSCSVRFPSVPAGNYTVVVGSD